MFQYVLLINPVRVISPKMVWDIHRLIKCPSGFSPDWSGEITFNSGFPPFWWHWHMLCWNKISQYSKKVWVGSGGFLRLLLFYGNDQNAREPVINIFPRFSLSDSQLTDWRTGTIGSTTFPETTSSWGSCVQTWSCADHFNSNNKNE